MTTPEANALRDERVAAGLTIRDVAREAELDESVVGRIERGVTPVGGRYVLISSAIRRLAEGGAR